MQNNEADNFLELFGSESPKEDTEFALPEEKVAEEPATEEKETEEEDKVPFNKNPKVLKFIEREVKRLTSENKPETPTAPLHRTEDEDPLTDVLTRVIGNDTAEKISAIKDFKKALESRDQRVKEDALSEINARADRERQAEIDAQNEVSDALDAIEETFDIDMTSSSAQAKKVRGEFLDFVGRVAPKNQNGDIVSYPDFVETYKVFREMNRTPSNDRAKSLASRSIAPSSEATVAQPTGSSWDDTERMIAKLLNR